MNAPLEQVRAWLDRPVYAEGVVLYERLIGQGFMLSMLKTGPDDYNRNALTTALQAKAEELITAHEKLLMSYPEQLNAQLGDGKILMDERTILKERLRMQLNGGVTQSEEMKGWTYRILEIRDALGEIYGRKEFFDRHGYLPEVAAIDAEQTPLELLKRRGTLRTYITRYTQKLKRINSAEQQQTYVQLLEQYRTELHLVEQQLNALTDTHHAIHD